MRIIREIWRLLIPLSVRRISWNIVSSIKYVFSDREPKSLWLSDYEVYWEGRSTEDISHPELIELCKVLIPPNVRVLDFGCGGGELLAELTKSNRVEGLGLDIAHRAVEIAIKRGVDARQFELVELSDLEQLGHFDYAIATEVVEHIPESEKVIQALAAVAAHVIISIPNTGYILYRLRLLMGRFPRQWHEHPAEHVRFWTIKDMRFTLRWLGLTVEKVIGFNGGRLGQSYPALFAPNLLFVVKDANQ